MKLNVLPAESSWYADGLNFTCSQCGNCCTGGPGFVWISREEVVRLGEYLHLTPSEVVEQYCRTIDGQLSLRERRNAQGSYDCIFLREERAASVPGSQTVAHSKRVCGIYSVRPLQCRTWPFWPENLASKKAWDEAGRKCHGINQGRRFSARQIDAVCNAKDWPQRPPTSAK